MSVAARVATEMNIKLGADIFTLFESEKDTELEEEQDKEVETEDRFNMIEGVWGDCTICTAMIQICMYDTSI